MLSSAFGQMARVYARLYARKIKDYACAQDRKLKIKLILPQNLIADK